MPTGAVSGFCNMLYKLLEDIKSADQENRASHFAVIFDSARKNFRNEIYSDYKANRSEAPDDLVPQFEYPINSRRLKCLFHHLFYNLRIFHLILRLIYKQ